VTKKVVTGQDLIDFVVKHNAQTKHVVCLPPSGKGVNSWAAEVLSLGMCDVVTGPNDDIPDLVITIDSEYAK
jgi:hypothetical protein